MNKIRNWTLLFQEYKGKWVAFKDDEKTVMASGRSAKTAYKQARKFGVKIPILFKVPETSLPYVGYGVE